MLLIFKLIIKRGLIKADTVHGTLKVSVTLLNIQGIAKIVNDPDLPISAR